MSTGRGPMTDPHYTSIDILPVDNKENGMCSLCGSFVLSYSLHTIWHQEILEAFGSYTAGYGRHQVPMPDMTQQMTIADVAKALGSGD